MIFHAATAPAVLHALIRRGEICYGGNAKLKIYGLLTCASGKRMHLKHRVFFASEQEALDIGYRPCGHCMYSAYKEWKHARNAHA